MKASVGKVRSEVKKVPCLQALGLREKASVKRFKVRVTGYWLKAQGERQSPTTEARITLLQLGTSNRSRPTGMNTSLQSECICGMCRSTL